MGRQRIIEERTQTGAELKRRHDDIACSIDGQLDEAIANINWSRRSEAEKSLDKWVNTYMCDGLALNDPPPQHGIEVLQEMHKAIVSHKNYLICMGRGSGKSSYCICASLFAIATGIQKYIMIVSNNARAASGLLNDMWRVIAEKDTAFAQDYPQLAVPFHICNGSFRRRQLYKGASTEIQKNAGNIVFPRIKNSDGTEAPSSGSVITCRGVSSGLRGAKHGTMRPTCVLLDDLQTMDTAQNPEQVQKLLEIIQKDVMPLAGKERLSILQTATPITCDDLVDKIKSDKSWTTQTYPAIIQYPSRMDMWNTYFKMFDQENVEGHEHDKSLKFYTDNQQLMDEGSEVFNPDRWSLKDGHRSAIQKLLEVKHTIGDAAFASEYQMQPKKLEFALDITPGIVASRRSSLHELEVPDSNVAYVVASSDLNLSKYITTTITVFMRDQTACVIWHTFKKCRIDMKLPEVEYNQKTYSLLAEHGRELKQLGIRIDAWVIDANGVPFNAVTDFAKNSLKLCGIPAAGFIGKAAHMYTPFMKSRLKEDVGQTLLCGSPEEHVKAGTGRKYTFWNSDYYRELVQKSFNQEVGAIGSLSLYDGDDHTEWAMQACAEKLVFKRARQDGRYEYHWKSSGDHDALDSIAQAYACYYSQGFAVSSNGKPMMMAARKPVFKKRIRFV